jgi:hypothetical protein
VRVPHNDVVCFRSADDMLATLRTVRHNLKIIIFNPFVSTKQTKKKKEKKKMCFTCKQGQSQRDETVERDYRWKSPKNSPFVCFFFFCLTKKRKVQMELTNLIRHNSDSTNFFSFFFFFFFFFKKNHIYKNKTFAVSSMSRSNVNLSYPAKALRLKQRCCNNEEINKQTNKQQTNYKQQLNTNNK